MRTRNAIEHFGGVAALAAALGIRRQAIYQWGDRVPPHRALQIERVTEGSLRADESDYQPKSSVRER